MPQPGHCDSDAIYILMRRYRQQLTKVALATEGNFYIKYCIHELRSRPAIQLNLRRHYLFEENTRDCIKQWSIKFQLFL